MSRPKICKRCKRQRDAQEDGDRCRLWDEYKSMKRGCCLAYEPLEEEETVYYYDEYREWN